MATDSVTVKPDPQIYPITLGGLLGKSRVAPADPETIALAVDTIRRQGWCFVNIDHEAQPMASHRVNNVTTKIRELLDGYNTFFQKSDDEKRLYSCAEGFGYNRTPVREGMRVVTGFYAQCFDAPLTEHMVYFDELMVDLLSHLSLPLFECEANEALDRTNSCLSILETRREYPVFKGFGMLDIVKYSNNPEDNTRGLEENVPGHFDPGILSFSMTSSEPGLQLFDPVDETWIDCPLNVGVLWCGTAATELNPAVPAARHRVLFSENPRMSMWYEICAHHQVPGVVKENGMVPVEERKEDFTHTGFEGGGADSFSIFIRSTGKQNNVRSKSKGKRPPQGKRIEFHNVTSSTTMNEVLRVFEFETGMPRSKSRPRRARKPKAFDLKSGDMTSYDRDKTLGELGISAGDSVFIDWD